MNARVWKILLFSPSNSFFDAFNKCIDNKFLKKIDLEFKVFFICDELIKFLKETDSAYIIHLNAHELEEPKFKKLINAIRNDKNLIHYLIIWAKNPWEDLPYGFIEKNEVNDIRSLVNMVENRIAYILYTNIRNFKSIQKMTHLKENLETEVENRTAKLKNTNKKLKEAIINNSNNNTKLYLQRIQIEKQSNELQERNTELEKAFKKSNIQHIKLEKALRDNEKHRYELQQILSEIQEKNDRLTSQNEEIITQRNHIETQHEELQSQIELAVAQRDKIVTQQEEIFDNINYASRIQYALFPPLDLIQQLLPEHFLFNSPKDVVSGDFYWVSQNRRKTVIAVGDCTGHGISGAMMSMLGTAYLNEIINKHDVTNASLILEQLRERVISSLHQQVTDTIDYSRDGMDISVCIIDILDNTLEYAGANNPIYLFRNEELMELLPDRMPIGIHEFHKEVFHTHILEIHKNDNVFMFSDGYADQFGGKKGKKLKYNRFKQILQESCVYDISERENFLKSQFNEWKGENEQIDDVLVLGFRIV
ncbi:MAG: SpoIIE family protein phosphatase [Salinivirgaceae bacterium]|nr:SpoIIE family protein phosphatase [Salinivirgaceae bacterium]